MSLNMRPVIFSAFLVVFTTSGFVPREPTKQDIDIARIEHSKLHAHREKSDKNVQSLNILTAEDTTEDNNGGGDIGHLGGRIHERASNLIIKFFFQMMLTTLSQSSLELCWRH